MRKIILVSVLPISLIFLFTSNNSVISQKEYATLEEYVPNEVLVKFNKDVARYSIQDTINSVEGKIITYLKKERNPFLWNPDDITERSFRSDPDLFHIKVPESIGTERAIFYLKQSPYVKHVEKNLLRYPAAAVKYPPPTFPNDDLFDEQWGLYNQWNLGCDIHAANAWTIFEENSEIVVAVIDSGVDYNHDDLAANIWINPGETGLDQWGNPKESNGIDDDGNGYPDDFRGWDFYSGVNDPMDATGHGTHVAGIIGAVGNNGEGIAGVNWNVKIMPLKVARPSGGFSLVAIIQAVEYSWKNGAHISNNSYGGRTYVPDEYEEIENAKNDGQLFIAAAGGTGPHDNDENPTYPASYGDDRNPDELDNIIAVAATTKEDLLPTYSNYGANSVDLGAPGGSGKYPSSENDIISTVPNDGYDYKYGTSQAAPHVAGVAALIWRGRPDLNLYQVKWAITITVEELSSLSGKTITGGRLDACEALEVFPPIPTAPSSLNAFPTGYYQISLSWQDNSKVEEGYKIERATSLPNFSVIATLESNPGYPTGPKNYKDNYCTMGTTYYYRVKAYNETGDSSSNTDNATIPAGPPQAPDNLEAEFSWGIGVELWWSDLSNNEQGFKIYRKSEWDPSWEQIGTTGAGVNWYEDEDNLSPDTIYYYRVRAYNPYGNSSYSNIADVYVPWNIYFFNLGL